MPREGGGGGAQLRPRVRGLGDEPQLALGGLRQRLLVRLRGEPFAFSRFGQRLLVTLGGQPFAVGRVGQSLLVRLGGDALALGRLRRAPAGALRR